MRASRSSSGSSGCETRRAARDGLELTGYLEWCCGVSPAPRREFHKLFIETAFDPETRAIFAIEPHVGRPLGALGALEHELSLRLRVRRERADRRAPRATRPPFSGATGPSRLPGALGRRDWDGTFGRHADPVAALRDRDRTRGGRRAGARRSRSRSIVTRGRGVAARSAGQAPPRRAGRSRRRSDRWIERLAAHRMETADPRFDALDQRLGAVPGDLGADLGARGYYQQSGAFGFRDQLQDSQVWLTIDPPRCREQIDLHAAHQFADGSVYHWWHPLSEMGHVTKMTDDLLWLAFVAANYMKETGRPLDPRRPFAVPRRRRPAPLDEHVRRAFERVFRRTSPRGLPYIGAGDWNDGLSAAGLEEKGESIWLAHFLAGILGDWAEIHRADRQGAVRGAGTASGARRSSPRSTSTAGTARGTGARRSTAGSKIGSRENRVGRIYLNAQTWAILNDVAPPDRARACMAAVREHLDPRLGRASARPRVRRARRARSATSPATRRGCARTAASTRTRRPGRSPRRRR